MKKSVSLLILATVGSSYTIRAQEQLRIEDKYNVLFVVFDDLRPELGCYGADHMITPNIDAIAKEGVVFKRAYVQQAVSAASRASFLTGCYPNTTGSDYPYSDYFVDEFLPSHNTIQKQMYENGYYSRTLGKIHHGFSEDLSETHFESTNLASDYFALPENISLASDKSRAPAFESADVADNAYRDGVVCDEAIETIKGLKTNAKGKPFFLAVGFQKPHLPFAAPKKYYDMYDPATLPLSPNPEHTVGVTEYSAVHFALSHWKGEKDNETHVVSDSRQRELRHGYFACVSYVDAQLGKIVSELKAQDLYDNTVIVIIGDHGWHLGDNGMYGKSTNFESSTNAPLIVKYPGKSSLRGVETDALVEYIDVYPTICDAVGVEIPEFIEGTSLMPLMYDVDKKWKSAAFSQFPRGNRAEGFSVRTDRYRYTEWRDSENNILGQELYDHKKDSNESVNIASSNPKLVKKLATILHDGWKDALPPNVVNSSNNRVAPPAVVSKWKKKKK